MLKLMELEMKKYKIGGSIKAALRADIITIGIIFLAIAVDLKTGDGPTFSSLSDAFYMTGLIVKGIFTIFASVLISRYIIDEYSNKTINLMFMYPINRKKIMLSKLLVIVLFTFSVMVISNIFINSAVYIFNMFVKSIKDNLTLNMVINNLIHIVINSAYYSFLSLTVLYVGMKKKTSASVIVTAIILTSILSSGSKTLRLDSISIIPCILGIIGMIISYISIKDVENDDVTN